MTNFKKIGAMILWAALALVGPSFSPDTAFAKLSLVQEVDDGIWRGSQPIARKDFVQLQEMGIKVIINIQRKDDKRVAAERAKAEEMGFKFIHIPMDPLTAPSAETMNAIFEELTKSRNHPLYLHCTLGRDRTGLVFALYRVRFQNMSPAKAYEEWTSMGFSGKFLKGLDGYFKEQTGFVDSEKRASRRRARQCNDRLT